MIPKDRAFKLIKICMYVCERYDVNLYNYSQRCSNNSVPVFSYQTFNYRLNRMVGAVTELSKQLLGSHKPEDCDEDTLIVDSLPIMTCTGRNRTGKVAIAFITLIFNY